MEHFIKTIKNYPCIWNTETEEYKTIQLKEAAWRCVIKQCDIPDVREAKHIWKKLRDGHRQALKKRKPTGQPVNNWKYEDLMAFLIPHFKHRPSSTNEYKLENFESTFQSLSSSDNESENSEISEPERKKGKKGCEEKKLLLKSEPSPSIERDILGEEIFITEQENNSVKAFFDSMSEMCKSLPEYSQMQVQRAVFNIVMDAREENARRMSNA